MTAFLFVLSRAESGKPVGFGMLCAEARYCSFRPIDAKSIGRRFLDINAWKQIAYECADTFPSTPLPRESACAHALSAGNRWAVTFGTRFEVEQAGDWAAEALDQLLVDMSTKPEVRQDREGI